MSEPTSLLEAVAHAGHQRLHDLGFDFDRLVEHDPGIGMFICLTLGSAALQEDGWRLVPPEAPESLGN